MSEKQRPAYAWRLWFSGLQRAGMMALLALGPACSWGYDNPVEAGIAAYQDGAYRAAAQSFTRALQTAPDDASLHHWLGKCYGRIAERGNWLVSMSYAKKTLRQFRKAVALDAHNYEALRDLADYLESAPRFLGGNQREAAQLKQQLALLRDRQ